MDVHTNFRFHPQVVQVGYYFGGQGHGELYILEGAGIAVIDTGCSDSPTRYIEPALKSMGRGLEDVEVIVNTHGHFDHAGGNSCVVAASGARVWLPERDVEIAEDLDLQFERYLAPDYALVGREDKIPGALADLKNSAEPTKVDRVLRDEELLDLGSGIELRVVPGPGHSDGSVAFYWEREGMLFTGDGVLGSGSRPGGLPLVADPEAYEQTLNRLAGLDINVLCLGHHYVTLSEPRDSVKFGRAGKRFLQQSLQIAEIIAEGVEHALESRRNAPFVETARAALSEIGERIDLDLNAETGMPAVGGIGAIYSNWKRYAAK